MPSPADKDSDERGGRLSLEEEDCSEGPLPAAASAGGTAGAAGESIEEARDRWKESLPSPTVAVTDFDAEKGSLEEPLPTAATAEADDDDDKE